MFRDVVYEVERELLEMCGAEFLSVEKIDSLLDDVGFQIEMDESFTPDVVVGIMRGGLYPGQKLAERFDVPFESVDVGRPRDKVAGFEIDDLVLVRKAINRVRSIEPIVSGEIPGLGEHKQVLLVDDDCFSGRTFEIAMDVLGNDLARAYRRAVVLAYEGGLKPEYVGEVVRPVNRFLKSSLRFPWERCSPYWRSGEFGRDD